jgi:hypothetical protein
MLSDRVRRQRSQSMVEFALIAPLLLLMLFGMVDFGRVIYTYITLNQAVNEGARVAIRDSPLLPSNADVETAVRNHAVDVALANPCPNGPVTTTTPPQNQGWIYITEPYVAGTTNTVEALSPTLENAPGGQMWGAASGGCSATNPAHDHAPLQVTICYKFVPFTPMLQHVLGNTSSRAPCGSSLVIISGGLVISAAAVYRTEY